MNRDKLLEEFHEVITHDKVNEGDNLDAKIERLFEAISASQSLLAILINLYRDATGEDISNGVIMALRNTLKILDDDDDDGEVTEN